MSLSIIIPVKNEEKIIEETLKYFANSWIKEIENEIIIIDDFSDVCELNATRSQSECVQRPRK